MDNLQPLITPILEDLRSNSISGLAFGHRHSQAMDAHIIALAREITDHSAIDVAIIATGGYGREELCPYSDIDLLFLTADKASDALHKHIESFLYKIWDSGIKIGHSVRTTKECIAISSQDSKVLSSLLDARLITGSRVLFDDLESQIRKRLQGSLQKNYVRSKLDERDTRHERLGNSRYVLEPNIKDGKGSLRDYHTLFWIARVVYDAPSPRALTDLKIISKKEQQRFEKGYEFLLTVRCHLHDIARRAEERLHFDIQPELARRLGYQYRDNAKAVERFMKHYFLVSKDVGDLTRIVVAAIEESENQKSKLRPSKAIAFDGFALTNDRLHFAHDKTLKGNPLDIIRLFRVAQQSGHDLHPIALQKIRRNIKLIDDQLCRDNHANALFLEILTDDNAAAQTLRRMNEADILERFIPEFRKIKGLMQFDRYHVYTVDEHTLNAVDVMHRIESGALRDAAPLASLLIQGIENRRALYVAIFLHDICKGREKKGKGQDHSSLGAELALKLCPRLGLNDRETRLVSWLVFEHLFMSDIAFKRDLEDPKTLEDFLFRIPDKEHLKLLTILTACDILAVGPDRWSGWKESLLHDLYERSERAIKGLGSVLPSDTTTERMPENTLSDEIADIDIAQDEAKQATIIRIKTLDRPGLFATLTGALTAANVDIIEARINTGAGNIAEDVYTVQTPDRRPITKTHRHNDIRANIINALNDSAGITARISDRIKKPTDKDLIFDIPNAVEINNTSSTNATYVEVSSRDRQGLLYDIATCITDQGLIITHAKINTLGLRAVDVFYVQTPDRNKIDGDQKLAELQAKILKTLEKDVRNT